MKVFHIVMIHVKLTPERCCNWSNYANCTQWIVNDNFTVMQTESCSDLPNENKIGI